MTVIRYVKPATAGAEGDIGFICKQIKPNSIQRYNFLDVSRTQRQTKEPIDYFKKMLIKDK